MTERELLATADTTCDDDDGSGVLSKEIYLAGGCFWGVEAFLKRLPGIVLTQVGYANGTTQSPSYEDVCSGTTHHAETVRCVYDPQVIGLPLLLEGFFSIIDPTSVNRQGEDAGEQYRTGVWWVDEADAPVVAQALKDLQARTEGEVVVESGPLGCFYDAEDYHQDYLDKNPSGYCHVDLGAATRFISDHFA